MRRILAILLGLALAISLVAQPERKMRKKKKNEDKEPVTQTLAVLAEPPAAIAADTARLTFQVSPLSAKGLLSQQSRDALKALMQANRGGSIVRLRAFVAGTGDMRRVQTIVSETFGDKKLALPVLSTVQVGALPLVGAQVVIEAVTVDKKPVNAHGVAFFTGERASDIRSAVEQLRNIAGTSGVSNSSMATVTCYLSSLEEAERARSILVAVFPQAALNLVEAQRLPSERFAVCEGAGRVEAGRAAASSGRAAVVKAPRLILSGLQMAFGAQESDLRLAFDRLKRALSSVKGTGKVTAIRFYALDRTAGARLPGLGRELFNEPSLLMGTFQIEGLPSLDASIAMDAIAEAAN